MAKIRLRTEDTTEEIIELLNDIYTIGRSEDNDISLLDRLSSRHHGQIIKRDSKYFFEDIGSANGSFINNQKLPAKSPQLLANNDIVIIGRTELIFEEVQAASAPQLMPYNETGMLIDTEDTEEYELSATLDASISLAQLSETDSHSTESMQKALKRLEAMCVISESIGNIMDQTELLKKVLQTVFGLFPKAGRAFILQYIKYKKMIKK